LIDPDRRSRYDAGGADASGGRRAAGVEGFDFSSRGVDHSATFGDLFAEVLRERGTRPESPERGADLHQEIRLTFEEALRGMQQMLTITRRETCQACAGIGRIRTANGTCLTCHGNGSVRSVRGHMVFSHSCPGCGGTGQLRPRPCDPCGGTGQETRTETVQVRIPAGITDASRVRIPGNGNAGSRGGPPGDLYITVHVAPHVVFRREGDDLLTILPVAIHEAALGARIEVTTPDGVASLRVPPGTQSGQRFRLRDRGATSSRDGSRGDLIVEVRLMLPRILDERSKELLREFGRLNGESVRSH
jgi:molecular chaperone DnaJ